MAYYPKNRIQLNLYTNGEEYVIRATGTSYRGYYYKLYNGTLFTGKTPNDGTPQELVLASELPEVQVLSQPDKYLTKAVDAPYTATVYEELTPELDFPKQVPYPSYPTPTQQDYKIEEFQRYFVKKVNAPIYIEVSQNTYNNVFTKNQSWNWEPYVSISIPWQLVGTKNEVAQTNKNIVALYEVQNRIFGFANFIEKTGGYLKFYQFPNISNLYTSGGEFKTADGRNYVGFYHIHDKTGPMVGATHIKEPHGLLFPVNETIVSQVINQQIPQIITQTTSSYTPPTTTTGGGGGFSVGGGGGGY